MTKYTNKAIMGFYWIHWILQSKPVNQYTENGKQIKINQMSVSVSQNVNMKTVENEQ